MNDTVKIMFIVQIAMYHYDMYVKVAYDNFDNKRRYDDDDDEEVLSHHVFWVKCAEMAAAGKWERNAERVTPRRRTAVAN